MNAVLEQISKIGIVPVVKIDNAADALPLAKALCAGGLPCAEVTFRTSAAAEAIKIMTDNFPSMCVGAGTVLNAEQVDAAVAAGAKFIVSPGLNPRTVKYCVEKNIPITPGTSSPSDIEQAIELGLDVVKFFPAEQSGGLAKIKAMAAPYVNMKFMPTGGVNAKNLTSYLDFPKIIACGGSWMVPGDLINAGEWDKIEQLTKLYRLCWASNWLMLVLMQRTRKRLLRLQTVSHLSSVCLLRLATAPYSQALLWKL